MAITRIDYPTSGTPASNADYTAQNNLIYAAAYRNPNAWKLNNWDNASIPVLKQGLYLRHYNHTYQVTGSDYTIQGSPVIGVDNWVVLSGHGSTITATWSSAPTGFSYNQVYNGHYNSAGDQLLLDFVHPNWASQYFNGAYEVTGQPSKTKRQTDETSGGYTGSMALRMTQAFTSDDIAGLNEREFASVSKSRGGLSIYRYVAGSWREVAFYSDSAIAGSNSPQIIKLAANRLLVDVVGSGYDNATWPNRWIIYDWNGSTLTRTATTNSYSDGSGKTKYYSKISRMSDTSIIMRYSYYIIYTVDVFVRFSLSGTTWTQTQIMTMPEHGSPYYMWVSGLNANDWMVTKTTTGDHAWSFDVYRVNGSGFSLVTSSGAYGVDLKNPFPVQDNLIMAVNSNNSLPATSTCNLKLYSWDGSNLSAVGYQLALPGEVSYKFAALDYYSFIAINANNDTLQLASIPRLLT